MLAPAQRVRRRTEFTTVVREGRRSGRGALVVHLRLPVPVDGSDEAQPVRDAARVRPPRAGFVVSKAVGRAVTRNAVRRRLRHLVRDRLATLPPGAVLVVRAQPSAARAAYSELGADLDAALAGAARRPRRRPS